MAPQDLIFASLILFAFSIAVKLDKTLSLGVLYVGVQLSGSPLQWAMTYGLYVVICMVVLAGRRSRG